MRAATIVWAGAGAKPPACNRKMVLNSLVLCVSAAGKSNLMDAVSFVMGVNTKDLRGAKVADFRSHGLSKSDANTSVTLHHRDTSRRSLPLVAAICSVL